MICGEKGDACSLYPNSVKLCKCKKISGNSRHLSSFSVRCMMIRCMTGAVLRISSDASRSFCVAHAMLLRPRRKKWAKSRQTSGQTLLFAFSTLLFAVRAQYVVNL